MPTDIPHLAFPLTLVGNRFAVVEQDGVDDIAGCVAVALVTPRGTRSLIPGFGTLELPFILASDVGELVRGAESSEPRARIISTAEFEGTDAFNLVVRLLVTRSES